MSSCVSTGAWKCPRTSWKCWQKVAKCPFTDLAGKSQISAKWGANLQVWGEGGVISGQRSPKSAHMPGIYRCSAFTRGVNQSLIRRQPLPPPQITNLQNLQTPKSGILTFCTFRNILATFPAFCQSLQSQGGPGFGVCKVWGQDFEDFATFWKFGQISQMSATFWRFAQISQISGISEFWPDFTTFRNFLNFDHLCKGFRDFLSFGQILQMLQLSGIS